MASRGPRRRVEDLEAALKQFREIAVDLALTESESQKGYRLWLRDHSWCVSILRTLCLTKRREITDNNFSPRCD
jgi:hypothetical protein